MKGNNMDFVTRYDIFQRELFNAFSILIEERGKNGMLNIKGLGVTFDGNPIASVNIDKGRLYFLTDNEGWYYGFFSGSLKDMCHLYDDIAEALEWKK